MEIIAFTLPFIVAIFLLLFFRKETTPLEYVLLVGSFYSNVFYNKINHVLM